MTSGNISVRPVDSKGQLRLFIKFPWRIYHDDPVWVPPLICEQKNFLDPRKNPFFEHGEAKYFIAWRGEEPAGRIAAIVNRTYNEYYNEKAGFFGFFECVEDYSIAEDLFDAAAQWVKQKGMHEIYGPESFSTNDECGFQLDGYDRPPMLLMPHSKPYYIGFAERYGFTKAKDLYAYYIDRSAVDPHKVIAPADKIREKGRFSIRNLRMRRFREEVDLICDIYNTAWKDNWGFIPMTAAEVDHLKNQLKPIVDPELVFFAEVEGQPAAFCVGLPDYNQVLAKLGGRLLPFGIFKLIRHRRKIDAVRILILGVKQQYQRRGIETVFIAEILRTCLKKGYYKAEMSWTLEDNILINRAIERIGAERYKTYRIYQKRLENS